MPIVPGVLAVMVAAAGGWYLFVSRGASGLAGIEDAPANQRRVRLRRVNGVVLILLAAALFVLLGSLDRVYRPGILIGLAATAVLLAVALVLAFLDVRLTRQMRERLRDKLKASEWEKGEA